MYDGRRGFDAGDRDLPRYDDGNYSPPPGRTHQRRVDVRASVSVRGAVHHTGAGGGEHATVARNAIVLFGVVTVVMVIVLLLLRP